ncbi:UDP-2,4-diacetamido-2,4,6-trideoxy-beta-L-altropyranose hydrolase [Celerinatantimonas yamalensis]|uniref:UDP-2,4-diacetamido-2,4, 6-trideoxy-beta-L-altropyranose hydrolase n=1 Tax=Celerinatantimonas yamalensis TaxID=559956 RepID=A0ABW9GB96_9GAMM
MRALKVLFRLDATSAIGTGHLMRCLTLAQAFITQAKRSSVNISCGFYTQALPQALAEQLKLHGFEHLLADRIDADIMPILNWQTDLLIVDHYGLDANWERQLYDQLPILVLDDLADRSHCANWLLDQGPLRQAKDYQPQINVQCQLLLGCQYTLINPVFRQIRHASAFAFRRGFICFGGADPVHATLTTLHSLSQIKLAQHIDWQVVAGAANPDWQTLQSVAQHSTLRLHLHRHEPNIPAQLANADFAIGAAGGMTWERCCVGIPTLCVPIVDNQSFNAHVIKEQRLGELLSLTQLNEPATLEATLCRLRDDASGYLKRSQSLIDGLGASRLAHYLVNQLIDT